VPTEPSLGFWRSLSRSSLLVFAGAVFFTFSAIGFVTDMQSLGQLRPPALAASVLLSGLPAIAYAWLGLFARGRRRVAGIALTLALQVTAYLLVFRLFPPASRASIPADVRAALGPRMMASGFGCIASLSLGYVLFVLLINREGARYFRWKAEVDLAAAIHRELVPPVALRAGDLEFYGVSEPATEVGGDLIDVVDGGGRWVAYIADVAGHGVAPGVVMGMVKSAARMALAAGPADLLDRLNRVLHPLRGPQMFVTFAYVAADDDGLEYGIAGHPPILRCTARGEIEELPVRNVALGILAEHPFVTGRVRWAPGDTLLLVTDGLIEVEDARGQELGLTRLGEVLAEHAGAPLARIAEAILEAACRHGPRRDDQSLLLVRRLHAATAPPEAPSPEPGGAVRAHS
jgi:sigma-B regulation protein RsbU (phosphoserine phosphatase)